MTNRCRCICIDLVEPILGGCRLINHTRPHCFIASCKSQKEAPMLNHTSHEHEPVQLVDAELDLISGGGGHGGGDSLINIGNGNGNKVLSGNGNKVLSGNPVSV